MPPPSFLLVVLGCRIGVYSWLNGERRGYRHHFFHVWMAICAMLPGGAPFTP